MQARDVIDLVEQVLAGGTAAHVTATAKAVAAQYGQTDGSGGVTVTVNQPPASGSHMATAGAVEVIVKRTETPFFASFFVNSAAVASRAVAVAGSGGGKYCVLALDNVKLPPDADGDSTRSPRVRRVCAPDGATAAV